MGEQLTQCKQEAQDAHLQLGRYSTGSLGADALYRHSEPLHIPGTFGLLSGPCVPVVQNRAWGYNIQAHRLSVCVFVITRSCRAHATELEQQLVDVSGRLADKEASCEALQRRLAQAEGELRRLRDSSVSGQDVRCAPSCQCSQLLNAFSMPCEPQFKAASRCPPPSTAVLLLTFHCFTVSV